MSRKLTSGLVLIAVAIGCAVAIWLGVRSTPSQPEPATSTASSQPSAATPGAAAPQSTSKIVATQNPARGTKIAQATATPAPSIQAWEMQIDEVLRSNASELDAAQILINTLPSLPEEGKIEAAHHISNLLSDKDYSRVLPIVLNPSISEPVLSVFVTDLMNRADSTKLPTLLEIAKISNHPFHEEALSDLQIYLSEDYGSDWTKWQAAVQKYLSATAAAQ